MLLFPIGLIFVFFNINLPLFGRMVDILPDAVGYLLIAANARQLRGKSYSFSNLVNLSGFLAVYSLLVRLIKPTGMAGLALSLLELILQLYLLKWIVNGVGDLERVAGAHLNTDVLDRWRLLLSGVWTAVFICAAAGVLAPGLVIIGLAAAAAWAVLCILFLATLLRTARRYRLLLKHGPPKPDRFGAENGETDMNGDF